MKTKTSQKIAVQTLITLFLVRLITDRFDLTVRNQFDRTADSLICTFARRRSHLLLRSRYGTEIKFTCLIMGHFWKQERLRSGVKIIIKTVRQRGKQSGPGPH